VLVDKNNNLRYPVKDGAGGVLKANEVLTIISEALKIANRARAQIRRPLGVTAQVSVTVVDTTGEILGLARTPDGPLFGTDVAVQKARTALLFSHPDAATDIGALPPANYLGANGNCRHAVPHFPGIHQRHPHVFQRQYIPHRRHGIFQSRHRQYLATVFSPTVFPAPSLGPSARPIPTGARSMSACNWT